MTGIQTCAACLALLTTLAGAGAADERATELTRFDFTQVQMGVPWTLSFYCADSATANKAAEAAFARVAELNGILSDYDPHSELSRLSQTAPAKEPVPVSDDLWLVLERSQRLARQTEGAFDVTVGQVIRLWRRARRAKELPSDERLKEALATVGREKLVLDAEKKTARLTAPNMRLDLGGIAMGYAADEAFEVLKSHGICRAMVDASGDIRFGAPPPGKTGWRVGIAPLEGGGDPSMYVELANAAITTSGDAFQHVEIAGRRYSHIVDPKTGLGLSTPSSVSIIANDCLTADSLATAASVLPPEKAIELIEATEGAAGVIIRGEEEGAKVYRSKRLEEFVVELRSTADERSN